MSNGRKRKTRKHPKGIRLHGAGWQAYFRFQGEFYSESFPLETDRETMQSWIATTKAELRLSSPSVKSGTFAADAARYLRAVAAMPSIASRKAEIQVWIDRFGHRARASIRPDEIRAIRDQWITEKRTDDKGKTLPPYAASTINLRLRALSNLYTVLDAGRRFAVNPVRLVPEVEEPDPQPRGLPYNLIVAIIDALPDFGLAVRGYDRPTSSKSKARIRLIAYSGLPPATIKRIDPHRDIDWQANAVFVRRREKGKGAKPAMLPMNMLAMAALGEMQRLDAFGPFDTRALNRVFKRGVEKVRVDLQKARALDPRQAADVERVLALLADVSLYDLRHSFLTSMMSATNNLPLVQRFAQHQSPAQTAVYAQRAIDPALRAAQDAFANLTATSTTIAILPSQKTDGPVH